VGNDGTRRLAISDKSHMPPPIINGKAYKRAILPTMILFCNEKGDERGGMPWRRIMAASKVC
jgi:hypothetical protein